MSSRILIVTASTGDPWYGRVTLPTQHRYAEKIGADFLTWRQPHNHACYDGNGTWGKIDAMQWFANGRHRYDWLVSLDLDIIINPLAPSIVDHSQPDRLNWVREQIDTTLMPWAIDHGRRYNQVELGADLPYYNAGVMVVHREFVRTLDLGWPWPNHCLWDQDVLNVRAHQQRMPIHELPVRFNWIDFNDRDWHNAWMFHGNTNSIESDPMKGKLQLKDVARQWVA